MIKFLVKLILFSVIAIGIVSYLYEKYEKDINEYADEQIGALTDKFSNSYSDEAKNFLEEKFEQLQNGKLKFTEKKKKEFDEFLNELKKKAKLTEKDFNKLKEMFNSAIEQK